MCDVIKHPQGFGLPLIICGKPNMGSVVAKVQDLDIAITLCEEHWQKWQEDQERKQEKRP